MWDCPAHCRLFNIPGLDPIHSKQDAYNASTHFHVPPEGAAFPGWEPLPGRQIWNKHKFECIPHPVGVVLRNLAHTKDSRRRHLQKQRENQTHFSVSCTEKLVCLYAPHWGGTRKPAFLLFFIPFSLLTHLLHYNPYPQSLPKGKPDRPEWLSLSQGLRKTLDKRHSEGLSDQEYCGESREEARLLDKTNRQLEDKGRHLSHPLDPVCVLIQLIARFSLYLASSLLLTT